MSIVGVLVGAVLSAVNLLAGIAVLSLSVLSTIPTLRIWMRELARLRVRILRRLRIDPAIQSISMIDEIIGRAELDEWQNYTVSDLKVSGSLSIEAEWNDAAWSRVQTHKRRNHLEQCEDVRFSAGALVLRGPVGLTVTSTEGCRLVRNAALLLTDRVGSHELLRSADGRGRRNWRIGATYSVAPEHDKTWTMPIWVTPTIVPGSDRRSLELEFQWTKFGPAKDGMPLVSIDLLELTVPTAWGAVQSATDYPLVSISPGDGSQTRTIAWRNISDSIETSVRGRHPLSLTFKNEIRSLDAIHGRIVARFAGNICRITGVRVHGSNGAIRRERPRKRLYTQVRLAFRMSLAAVRYEAVRVLPPPPERTADGHVDDTAASGRPIVQEVFDRVIPNGATVAQVTARLSDDDYYVKRVVENPPQPSKKVSAIKRYWDISGRKYDGVYPIDFHLVLSGEEMHDGGVATSGKTEMALSVRGAYTSQDVDRRIHDEWRGLRRRVESALRSCRSHGGAAQHGSTLALISRLRDEGQLDPEVAEQLIRELELEFDVERD